MTAITKLILEVKYWLRKQKKISNKGTGPD